MPDNRRHTMRDGQVRLTRRYAVAKQAATLLVQCAWRRPALTGDVKLEAHVWVPDAKRRDLTNLAKLLHDVLALGGAIGDDQQLADVRYIRRGIDRQRPRVELTLTSLETET